MALLRTILAILIGFSLVVTPVGVAFASQAKTPTMAAMEHCDQKNMAQCPCCHKAMPCQFDGTCAAKCVKIIGTLTCPATSIVLGAMDYSLAPDNALKMRSWPPPAPPPRS